MTKDSVTVDDLFSYLIAWKNTFHLSYDHEFKSKKLVKAFKKVNDIINKAPEDIQAEFTKNLAIAYGRRFQPTKL